jgi:tetratricopeptide (TPR) repeat protein
MTAKQINYYFLLLLFTLAFAQDCFSQLAPRPGAPPPKQGSGDNKAAKDNFSFGNYVAALQEYEALVKKDPSNIEYNYKAGVCYLYTNFDKSKAIPYLEFVGTKPNATKEQIYDLARAYLVNNKLPEAIKYFELVKTKIDPKAEPAKMLDVVRQIEMCENAQKLMKTPVNVTFTNLGPKVNTPFADYNPFAPDEEDYVAFSTKRNDVVGANIDFDGYKCADIFYSEVKKGEYAKAKNLGPLVNTEYVEEIVGLSADGKFLFIGIDNMEGFDDIWASEKKGKSFQKSKTLGPTINSLETETSATTDADANVLYFSRTPLEDKTGFGGTDIFIAYRLPNGDWGEPINLGPQINTPYDEDFPNLSADGKTLFFCSKGHNSMGGFDVFKSTWDEKNKRWNRPQNLGYPLNTTDDNFTYSAPRNGRHGYLSQIRPEGQGDLDVYMVTYNDIEAEVTTVIGKINFAEKAPPKGLKVMVYTKNGAEKQFTEHYLPPKEYGWKFKEELELPPQPGFKYDVKLVGTMKGSMQTYPVDKLPKDLKDFKWMDTKITKVKQDPKEQSKVEVEYFTFKERKDVVFTFEVRKAGESEIYAQIRPNRRRSNYVLALHPGKYDIAIKAIGYKPIIETITVYDKGDYILETFKDIIMVQDGLTIPLDYPKP